MITTLYGPARPTCPKMPPLELIRDYDRCAGGLNHLGPCSFMKRDENIIEWLARESANR